VNITIGIPAYNEEGKIGSILEELKKITDSVIVCDDGSQDSTYDIAKNSGAMIIKHEKNLGYGAAINSIFKKCVEIDTDILITFDGDGQHRIEDINKIIKPIMENQADIVIGSRFLDDGEKEIPNYRKVGIKFLTQITNSTIKEKITDSQSGFRAYNKTVLEKIIPENSGMGSSTEILIKASNNDLRIAEVPIKIIYSGDTSTLNPVSHGASVFISTIKFTSIEHPLKFYGSASLVFFILGSIFTYFSIQFYVDNGFLNTNLTLLGAGLILIAIILLICAILLFSIIHVIREKK
tara:strand:+ start:104 stop:985 length:882 start_codon:yes stop_codon:yes gene_type:complete